MFPVNISPDMGMYNLLKSQGYDPAYAIAEFIDNALQAHLSQVSLVNPLKISIRFFSQEYDGTPDKNSIVIEDNGPGITKQRLISAMRPAKPGGNKGLSEFGIGMKAAAVWFTDEWILTTKPREELFLYSLRFNLATLLDSKTDTINVIEEETDSKVANGTKIVLSKLRRPINKHEFDSICKDIKELYQQFTSEDKPRLILNAYFNDEPASLKFEKKHQVLNEPTFKKIKGKLYAIGKAKEWKVDVSMNFQGVSVTGFICLLKTGSYATNPGLIMLRHERVIQGLSSKKFMPLAIYKSQNKHEAQRVYGELRADELPVSYTKDKFEINTELFALELKEVSGVKELLKQASEYRLDKFESVNDESDIEGVKPQPIQPTQPTQPTPTAETNETTQPKQASQVIQETPPELEVLDGSSTRRQLVKLEMLLSEFETNLYCENLIKQINWVFENKRTYKEIVICALRNLLENHLDFTYEQAFPNGSHNKFDDKLDEMLRIVRSIVKSDLNDFVSNITSLLNQKSRGYQTQSNLYKAHFSSETISILVSFLHLSAHKGSNIVSLDSFVSGYGKQYNMLLEILSCIAKYNKTINRQRIAP